MLRRVLQIIVAAALTGTAVLSARLGAADWFGRIPSRSAVERASRLDPWNGEWDRYRCQLEQLDGIDATGCWEAAARKDPRNVRILTEAGVTAEISSDFNRAERYFRAATAVSEEWLPRWSAANFYARRGRNEEALAWLKLAFQRSYGDLRPAFDLARQAGASIGDLSRDFACPSALCQASFSGWLTQTRMDAEAAAAAAQSIEHYMTSKQRAGLSIFGNQHGPVVYVARRLAEDGFDVEARKAWRAGCASGFLKCADPVDDGLLTNGSLAAPAYGEALDWTIHQPKNSTVIHDPQTRTIKFALSGNEDESFVLLSQWVTPSGSDWRVKIRYEMRGISARQAAGFTWQIDGRPLPMSWEEGKEATGELTVKSQDLPARRRTALFSLNYHRPPGSTRPEGELILHGFHAEALP